MYSDCINQKCNTVNLNEYSNEGYNEGDNEGEKKGEKKGYKEGEKKGRRKDCSYSVVYILSIFTFISILFMIIISRT
jgi:flagellar biosynthesis/type III secretory pathway protein FliH